MKKFALAVMFVFLSSVMAFAEVPVWRILWITLPKLNVNHNGILYKFDMTDEERNEEHELAAEAEKFIEDAANNKVDVQITLIDSEMEVTSLTEDTWIHVTEKDFPEDIKNEMKRAEDKGHPYNFWLSCCKLEGDSEKINSYAGLGGGRHATVRTGWYWSELFPLKVRIHELMHCFDWFYEILLSYPMPGTHYPDQWGYDQVYGGPNHAEELRYFHDTFGYAVYDPSNDRYIGISSEMWQFHPGNTHEYNGHTYQFFNIKTGWNDAKEYCEAIGGHLVSVNSQEEQAMLEKFMKISDKNQYTFWAGGEKTSGSWKWTTGENFSFSNFSERSDSGDIYLQLKAWDKYGEWRTSSENEKGSGFICEWDYMRGDLELKPTITTAYLPDTSVKAAYSKQLYSAGINPVSWTVTGLPDGLSCNVSGEITGSAAVQGNYTVAVTASNSEGTDRKSFALNVEKRLDAELSAENFPDETFREYLRLSFDKDNDGWLDKNEISAVTDIDVRGSENQKGNIYSLKGIEYFTNLTNLHCEYNRITELDLSRNTRLSWLECQSNDMESLNISGCASLWVLICCDNKISSLDISICPNVNYIDCGRNKLSELDTEKNTGLSVLLCDNNNLSSLNLDSNGNLTWLKCNHNNLTLLDLSNNVKLTHLYCNDNKLVWLNVDNCAELTDLYCWGNNITALNIGGCTKRNSSEWSFYHDDNTEIVCTHVDIKDILIKPVITKSNLPDAITGTPYTFQFSASGTGVITWTAENLPSGLTLDSSGLLSGTPRKAGNYTFTVTASNNVGTASKNLTLSVIAVPEISTASLEPGIVTQPYTFQFEAHGSLPIVWTYTGNLPPGLTFSESGLISGTPKKAGKYTFTVTASNTAGSDSGKFVLDVAEKFALPEITTDSLTNAITNQAYSLQLTATGTAPLTWTHKGNLPKGLTLDSSGVISGTPTKAGKYTFTVTASNSYGESSQKFTLQVYDPVSITTSSLKAGTIGKSYNVTMRAKGSRIITWSAEGLPNGLTINEKGKISGKPEAHGKFTVKITAANPAGSVTESLQLEIKGIAPKISGSLTKATLNESYSSALKVTGSTPLTLSIAGNLPEGLTFDTSTGIISGIPTSYQKSGYKLVITASNDAGIKSKKVTLMVKGTAPRITTAKLPEATVNQSYSFTLNATGSGPITFTADSLPEGLTLSDGVISGKPTEAAKSFRIVIYAENPVKTVRKSFTLKINDDEGNARLPAAVSRNENTNAALTDEVFVGSIAGEYVFPLGEISCDVPGMYDFSLELPDYVPEDSELVYAANSESPSDDDDIAEFFDDTGEEISAVPASRKIIISIWLNEGIIYKPVVVVKK